MMSTLQWLAAGAEAVAGAAARPRSEAQLVLPDFKQVHFLGTTGWNILAVGLVVSAIGLFFYTLINIANAATMDAAGDHIQGSSFGLTSLVNQIVVFPTPLVAGYLVERRGILSAFWLAGIFLLIGAVVLIPLKLYKGTRKASRS